MGVHDAAQWLLPAWVRTCIGAGATAPVQEIERVGERLLGRWSEPGRHYHNTRHLADVLAHVDELAEEAQRLGRIMRPKADGRTAHFYAIVARDTVDQEFAAHRQRFLAEQGYSYRIVDAEDVLRSS